MGDQAIGGIKGLKNLIGTSLDGGGIKYLPKPSNKHNVLLGDILNGHIKLSAPGVKGAVGNE
jgi:hypothetical protein